MEDNTKEEVIKGLENFLEFLGVKKNENTDKTPERILKAWQEMCRGINKESEIDGVLATKFPSKYTGMIYQGPIVAYSLCSHHLMPVVYEIHFGYIPVKYVLGLGKISKAISLLAAKPQNQEDLTQDIADKFKDSIRPEGLGVFVIGRHTCMFCRSNGVNHQNAVNITSAVRGSFRKNISTKEEFLKNINLGISKRSSI